MNRSPVPCLVMMLMLSVSTVVSAQDNSTLFSCVEREIKEKEPGWRLTGKRISRTGKYVAYGWRSGKSVVSVLMSAHASSEEATKAYEGLPFDYEVVGLEMTLLQMTVPNLGDDNYVWKDANDKKIFGVDFRKGNVVVHMSAPSIEIAKRFALHIADGIPAESCTATARTQQPMQASLKTSRRTRGRWQR